jgi:hypothetical protein
MLAERSITHHTNNRADPLGCNTSEECGLGGVCTNKKCTATCATDQNCPYGTYCISNKCVPNGVRDWEHDAQKGESPIQQLEVDLLHRLCAAHDAVHTGA